MTDHSPWFLALAACLATAAPALAQQQGQQPGADAQIPWLFIFLFLGLVALIVGAVTSRIFQKERKAPTVTRDLDDDSE